MKKIITTILSALCLFLGISFASCDGKEPTSTYTYFGVIQTLDGYDGLYVQVPSFGICELPTYEEGKTPNLALREGSLICMRFSSEIQVAKSYPAIIATPARSVTVEGNNFALQATEDSYLLTLDTTQEIRNQLLAYERGVGDKVWFRTIIGVPGTLTSPSAQKIGEYCSATIEKLVGERITLRLPITVDMQYFFKHYISGNLKFKGQSMDGTEEPFCNFFDVQASLEQSNIEKVVLATSVFSSSDSTLRKPTKYKTSALEVDIEEVYRWLKYTLVSPIIVEIPSSKVDTSKANVAELTVYSACGNFKIQEISTRIFKIWDKYYWVDLGYTETPTLEGGEVFYKFDYSMEKTVDFYNWEVFAGEYAVELSELSFREISLPEMPELGFFLKTDVGVIELYSNKIFYLLGAGYYEIIGEKDFSAIFQANGQLVEKILNNQELIKEIYAQKDHGEHTNSDHCCDDGTCEITVDNYYGEYESGAIVARIRCLYVQYGEIDAPWEPSSISIAGVEFPYGIEGISVFYEGEIYGLKSAYENGYLTQEDIASIAIRMDIFEYFSALE